MAQFSEIPDVSGMGFDEIKELGLTQQYYIKCEAPGHYTLWQMKAEFFKTPTPEEISPYIDDLYNADIVE